MKPISVKIAFQCPNCKVITEVEEELLGDEYAVDVEELTPLCFICKIESKF